MAQKYQNKLIKSYNTDTNILKNLSTIQVNKAFPKPNFQSNKLDMKTKENSVIYNESQPSAR